MTIKQILFPEKGKILQLDKSLISKYPDIVTDPEIQDGQPRIKGTRVIASDIFKARVKGYSFENILMQFKEMGVDLTLGQLNEAFIFTLEWLYLTHAPKKR